MPVEHVDKIEDHIAAAHQDVGNGEVHDEHVGDRSHLFVEQHDQNHAGIAKKRDDHHQRKQANPEDLLPEQRGVALLAGCIACYISNLAGRLVVVQQQRVIE